MPNLPPDPAVIAEIESAVAAGQYDAAAAAIAQGEMFFGAQPVFEELKQRLAEVRRVAEGPSQSETALQEAQAHIHRMEYRPAADILRRALAQDPGHLQLQELLAQTEQAAQRHAAAVERNHAVAEAATQIREAISLGDVRRARQGLEETGIMFGRHPSLEALGAELETLESAAAQQKVSSELEKVRALLAQREWRGAEAGAQQILRVAPENEDAQALLRQAREETEREIARRHQATAVDQVHRELDRLIGAGELGRAAQALQEAVQRFGPNDAFKNLEQRISRARSDAEAQQRVEWMQRRATEAASLVQEATRLSKLGDFDSAVAKLQQAKELDPQNPEVDGLLQAASSGSRRKSETQKRRGDFAALQQRIARQLDALQLDEAEALLHAARRDYGEEPTLEPLQTRLHQLREVEGGRIRLKDLDQAVSRDLLTRQQALGAAYTWKQAFLFPLRDVGPLILGAGLLLFLVLEVVASIAWPLRLLRWIAALVFAALYFQILRTTVRGQNHWPIRSALIDPKRWGLDAAVLFGATVVSTIPLFLYLLGARYHGLLQSWFGWMLFAALLWIALCCAALILAAAGTFGRPMAWRAPLHGRALLLGEPDSWLAINFFFLLWTTILALRGTLMPVVPWLGMPLAIGGEIYAWLVTPHVLGVVMRRHGAQMARLYGVR